MSDLIVKVARIAVVVFWIAMALSLVSVIPGPYGSLIVWIGGLVLIIHLLEYLFVKFSVVYKNGGQISFIKTILFGLTYLLPEIIDDRGKKQ